MSIRNKINIVLALLLFFTGFTVFFSPVKAETLQDELNRIQRERDQLRGNINDLQSDINNKALIEQGYSEQASKLYNEVKIFQNEIEDLELEIEELEVGIKLLGQEIEKNVKEIKESEDNIAVIEIESKARINDNYKSFRINGGGEVNTNNLFSTENINEYFKDSQYITKIQDDSNVVLNLLTELKKELEIKKEELAIKRSSLEKEKQAIEIKRDDLDKQKSELDVKMALYYQEINAIRGQIAAAEGAIQVFSQEEAEKAARAEAIQQQIFNSYTPVVPGEYVAAGRPIGNQGCTGLCTGPHVHFSVQHNGAWQNPCAYLPGGGPVSGCGGGGPLSQWPVSGSVLYTSGYGSRCFNWGGSPYCDFHTGIDLVASPTNAPVFATHNGYAYKGVDPYGAMYVVVCEIQGCGSGIKTGYWHLSSY